MNLRFILSYSFEAEKFNFGLPCLSSEDFGLHHIAWEVAEHLYKQSPVHTEEATHMRCLHCLVRSQKKLIS